MKKKLTEKEYNETYAALKLIEGLFRAGQITKNVFKNILNDYKDVVDLQDFRCYT